MVNRDIEYPGVDITEKFMPYFKPELRQNLIAAKVNPNKLATLQHDDTLFDFRVKDMPRTDGAHVNDIDTKVRFTCPSDSCKHTWSSGLGQLALIVKQ